MIHGILYRSDKYRLQNTILDGIHPALNINAEHKRIATWSNAQCWLAQSIDKGVGSISVIESQSNVRIVAWARLNNQSDLANKLNIKFNDLVNMSDAQLILRVYIKYGEECTNHLHGDFCFVVYDERTGKLFCVRDQMGKIPFYYYIDDHVLAFSSSLSLFHNLSFVPVNPCMEWSSKFLLANMSMDFKKTTYHNIFKLPPAHQFVVSDRAVNEKQYFSFHTHKVLPVSYQDYVDNYREQLERAIRVSVQTNHPLGSELSGGIDSSTVTAYAAKYFSGSRSDFYTFGFARAEHEGSYILQMNQHCNISNSYICCHKPLDVYDKYRALQALGAPVEHGVATEHEIFYDIAAKHQVRTLLSGFGGDEFVTSIHGDLYLHELLKNKKYRTLYKNLLGNPLTRALRLAKLYHYSDSQSGKINLRMRAEFDFRWPDAIIADDLINAYGIQNQYEALGDFDHGYHNLDQFTLEKRWVPFVTTRMENCTLMAATYGIDYRWPLLDVQLIQCFLSTPSSEKFQRGIGRYLHKRAIDGVVPKNIVWKQGKYMGERLKISASPPLLLNEDLHPDLLPLLNMEKLKNQVVRLPNLTVKEAFQIRYNINKVNQLDDWLKYYFKNGCEWKNRAK